MIRGTAHALVWGTFALSIIVPLSASAAVPKPTCVISTPPGKIYPGEQTRLIWYTENGDKASISHGIGEVKVPTSYLDVHPSVTTMYTMTVVNASGSNTCSAIVTVGTNPPSLLYYPTPIYQPVMFMPVTYVPNLGNQFGNQNGRNYGDTYYDYDEWESGGRSSNGRYDFWSDFTKGPSTGPSLFEMGYNYGNQPRPGESYTLHETGPDGWTYVSDCVQGYSISRCGQPYEKYAPDPTEPNGGGAGSYGSASSPSTQSSTKYIDERNNDPGTEPGNNEDDGNDPGFPASQAPDASAQSQSGRVPYNNPSKSEVELQEELQQERGNAPVPPPGSESNFFFNQPGVGPKYGEPQGASGNCGDYDCATGLLINPQVTGPECWYGDCNTQASQGQIGWDSGINASPYTGGSSYSESGYIRELPQPMTNYTDDWNNAYSQSYYESGYNVGGEQEVY